MHRTFLVALDGSPFGEAAVALALRWAKAAGAELLGGAVVDEPGIRVGEPTGVFGDAFKQQRDDALLARAKADVAGLLERFAARCTAAGVPYRIAAEAGDPAERILALAEHADLTVLGKHGFYHFETQAQADDTVDHVLRRTTRAVAVVPEHPPADGPVVAAYHAGEEAGRALASYLASGLAAGQTIHVVSVSADAAEASRHAEEAARFCRSHGADGVARPFGTDLSPANRILRVVEEVRASTVVMGISHHPWLYRWLRESTTEAVFDDCRCVLFLRG